ncbi:transposase [Streptomyces sp. IB201691-2A2]|uniref:transposase n=1 Tax=Streptomyces sp. IB201691-2A2 TaxID=2561920 RepID=UPI00117F1900|nr:hypothetical protein E4K73_50000 [Streptomyces sp. IB201691-2A2]
MVLKYSPPEFKADVVALDQSRLGVTVRSVAADRGVNPETLPDWVRAAGANALRTRGNSGPLIALEFEAGPQGPSVRSAGRLRRG